MYSVYVYMVYIYSIYSVYIYMYLIDPKFDPQFVSQNAGLAFKIGLNSGPKSWGWSRFSD